MKVDAHVRQTLAAKPKLVQISTAYGTPKDGSAVVPRNKYVEIRSEKPTNPKQRDWPEYKTCKFTTEAIVTEGNEKGELRKVCANPDCPIHHARKQKPAHDAQFKVEQEKRRREEAIANATGLRVLSAISAAVPVRLMKRDLLFLAERMVNLLDENRAAILAKQHGIKKTKENDSIGKLFAAFLRRADESTLGPRRGRGRRFAHGLARQCLARSARCRRVLQGGRGRNLAQIKQEFATKEKAKAAKKAAPKSPARTSTKTARRAAA
jgi:ParB family chromosome partitioning protein